MGIRVRAGTVPDVEACSRICYDAFEHVAVAHGYAPDFGSVDEARSLMETLLNTPDRVRSFVAERDSEIVGSAFVTVDGPVWGVGPLTVSKNVQSSGAGRALLSRILDQYSRSDAFGIRLVQTAYNVRSLALYTKLGFDPRESLACVSRGSSGLPPLPNDYRVRAARLDDVEVCESLCTNVHGFARTGEVRAGIAAGTAKVAEFDGQLVGYATDIGFSGHAVATNNDAIKALICSVPRFGGPGVLIPLSNAELLRWCVSSGMRVVQLQTLMALGTYQAPSGSYLPSIIY